MVAGRTAAGTQRGSRRRVLWAVMGVALVVALVIGSGPSDGRSTDDRLRAIAASVRCPTCAGQSVGTSDAPASKSIRQRIRTEVEQGRSDDEIRDRLTAAYGDDILLTPGRTGAGGLVWAVPVVAVIVAFVGLAFAFRRWERQDVGRPSVADRHLVEAALGGSDGRPGGSGPSASFAGAPDASAPDADDRHGEGAGR